MAGLKHAFEPLKSFWAEFQEDDITGLAAECAFRFFLALFPFVLFLVTLAAVSADVTGMEDPSGKVLDLLGDSLPADASSVIRKQVDEVVEGANIGLLSVSLASALWAAGGGAGALIKAVNRVYDVPQSRNFLAKTGMQIGLTLLGAVTLIGAVAAMVLTQTFAGKMAGWFGLSEELAWVVQVARLPLIVLFVMAAAQTVYWLSPDARGGFRWVSWGSAAFAGGWAAFTLLFALYVSNFASYNATYGALAGVVIMLFWFYFSSILFLTGAELNWWMERRKALVDVDEVAAADAIPPTPPQAAERHGARNVSGGLLRLATVAGLVLGLMTWARRRPAA